mmetsp:Transcript_102681/g.162300  ORF Transcript_102681/g.162300 Transcript_102681/m.162300 type:complete len:725 (-) Transcript_102681:21-2195(-)
MDAFAKLDELRKSVDREDVVKASSSWKEAETALTQALCAKRQEAKATAKEAQLQSGITDGLATRGEHVRLRKWRALTKQSNPQASPPLQRAHSETLLTDEDLNCGFAVHSSYDPGGDAHSVSEEISTRILSKSQRASEATSKRARHLLDRRESALEHTSEHGRRKLRSKIAEVLLEVRKRQELHAQQERARKFREKRFSRGLGPQASLGDVRNDALGIGSIGDSSALSPRRSALLRRTSLLDSLSLDDFEMLRKNPEWFFSGPAIASAAHPSSPSPSSGASPLPSSGGRVGSSSTLPSQIESNAGSSMTGNPGFRGTESHDSTNDCVFPDLVNFFSPTREDNRLPVAQYVQRLRAKNSTNVDVPKAVAYSNGDMEVGEYWKSLIEPEEEQEETEVKDDEPPLPLEMMPCCGRHPQIRDDGKSPTLLKMREVIAKKNEQDTIWLEDRRKALEGKSVVNASKAGEQQREHLLEVLKQKELHKAKRLQAEERKLQMEADRQQRTDLQNLKKIHQVMNAGEKAEEVKEQKRVQVQASLEKWHEGVTRASQQARRAEVAKRREGERSHKKYLERLNAIGESRQTIATTQAQKNDELKADIHTTLSLDMAERQHQERVARAEASKKKQEDAAIRRQKAKWGFRYCFSERAFGANAGDFDAKHHMVAVDRRGDSWRKSANEWARIKGTFSMPELPTAKPLSPGGFTGAEMHEPIGSPTSTHGKSEQTFFLT